GPGRTGRSVPAQFRANRHLCPGADAVEGRNGPTASRIAQEACPEHSSFHRTPAAWRLPLHSRRGRRRLPGAACAFRRIAIETLRERSLWCSIVGKSKAFGCIDTVAGLPVLSARARLAGFAMLNDNKGDVVAGGKIQDQP